MLTRVWSLVREEDVRSWSSSAEPAWDAAIRGNSALREAFLRALHDESYFKLGIENGHGLLDVKGFYDSIGWAVLVRTALSLNFPPTVLALELQKLYLSKDPWPIWKFLS